MKNQLGFSLLEVLIAVSITAILACYTLPYYQQSLIKNRRTEASLALENLSLALEHYYNIHHSYQTASFKSLNISEYTAHAYYQLKLDTLKANTYQVLAVPLGAQSQDKLCQSLVLDSTGAKSATGNSSKPLEECW